MADEKKPEAKSETRSSAGTSWFSHPDPFVEITLMIVGSFVILYILNSLFSIILSLFSGDFESNEFMTSIRDFVIVFLSYSLLIKVVLFIFSLLILGGVLYLFNKIKKLRLIERKLLYPEISTKKTGGNPQWERVLSHIESLNESDWRLSIMEADIMLSGLLDRLHLPGETMADKLKSVEKSDFTTIENAWEAHKIRNQIAHEGASFLFNQREAKRVIGLYESVFKEFQII